MISFDTWLQRAPQSESEKLFAIFSSASAAVPFKAWRHSKCGSAPVSVWDGTIYSEWKEVMPYIAIVDADSEFLQWAATTESRD